MPHSCCCRQEAFLQRRKTSQPAAKATRIHRSQKQQTRGQAGGAGHAASADAAGSVLTQLDAQAVAPNHSKTAGSSAASAPGSGPLAGIMGAITERAIRPPSAPMAASGGATAPAFPAAVHRSKSKVIVSRCRSSPLTLNELQVKVAPPDSQLRGCLPQFAQRRQRSQQQPQQEPSLEGPLPSDRAHLDNGADEASVPHAPDASSGEAPSERAQMDAENRARLAQMDPAEVSHLELSGPSCTSSACEWFSAPGHVQLVTAARRTSAHAMCKLPESKHHKLIGMPSCSGSVKLLRASCICIPFGCLSWNKSPSCQALPRSVRIEAVKLATDNCMVHRCIHAVDMSKTWFFKWMSATRFGQASPLRARCGGSSRSSSSGWAPRSWPFSRGERRPARVTRRRLTPRPRLPGR